MSRALTTFTAFVWLLVGACSEDTISHGDVEDTDAADGIPCGAGTGGICTASCADDLDCQDYSELAVCNPRGECESTASCLTNEVCGPEGRCSDWSGECDPVGEKALGDGCIHPAECRSGACADVCLEPCFANRDCDATQRCTILETQFGPPHGYCRVSAACEACSGETDVCDPLTGTCVSTCRTALECDGGDCIGSETDAVWTCTQATAVCPPDAFFLDGVCFLHRACRDEADCDVGHTCVAPVEYFDGGYCSPGVAP